MFHVDLYRKPDVNNILLYKDVSHSYQPDSHIHFETLNMTSLAGRKKC